LSERARRLALLLLLVEVAGIAWLVLNPSSATPTGAVYRVSDFLLAHGAPTWMASTTGWEYLLNVALFVPLGFLSSLIWERVRMEMWVVIGFAVSAGLEVTQLAVLGGRSATVSDVSANTVGMFAGALVGALVLSLLEKLSARR
jgi:glycopeptide antibiotics resistance protein